MFCRVLTFLLLVETSVVSSVFLRKLLGHSYPCLLVQRCESFSKTLGSSWFHLPSSLTLAFLLLGFVSQGADSLCFSLSVSWVWQRGGPGGRLERTRKREARYLFSPSDLSSVSRRGGACVSSWTGCCGFSFC